MKLVKTIEKINKGVFTPKLIQETIIDDLNRPIKSIYYSDNGSIEYTEETKYINCKSGTKEIELKSYGSNLINLISITYKKKYPYKDQIRYNKFALVSIPKSADMFDLINALESEKVLWSKSEFKYDKYGIIRYNENAMIKLHIDYRNTNYRNCEVIEISASNTKLSYCENIYYDEKYNRILGGNSQNGIHITDRYNFYDIEGVYDAISEVISHAEEYAINIYDKDNNLTLALQVNNERPVSYILINFYKYSDNFKTDEFELGINDIKELKDFDKFKMDVENGKYFIRNHRQYLYDNNYSILSYNSIL